MNSARCLLYRDELVLTEEEDEERYSSSEHLARVCNGASASPPPFSSDEGTIIVNNGSDQDQSCSDPDAMVRNIMDNGMHACASTVGVYYVLRVGFHSTHNFGCIKITNINLKGTSVRILEL